MTSESKANTRISLPEMAMAWAEQCSRRSTCDRLSVGAIVFTKDLRRVLGYGYNGNYAGAAPGCESNIPGSCGCVHAEINALICCQREEDMVMVVTDNPCYNCAKCIINAGIKVVYYRRPYRITAGMELLEKKIKVIKI